MTFKDNWKYRMKPMLSTFLYFIIQVGQTIRDAAAEPLSNSAKTMPAVPATSFLVAVAVMGVIALAIAGVGVAVIGLLMIIKVL